MKKKILVVQPKKCDGCKICELICSFTHEGFFSPSTSRIKVVTEREKGLDNPFFCLQCEELFCAEKCPTEAIVRDEETGLIVTLKEKCVRCGVCVQSCPFLAVSLHPDKKIPIRCDLCGGDPQCVKWCPEKALYYVDFETSLLAEKRKNKDFIGYMNFIFERLKGAR